MARYEMLKDFMVVVVKIEAELNDPAGGWAAGLYVRGDANELGAHLAEGRVKTPSKAVRAAFKEAGL